MFIYVQLLEGIVLKSEKIVVEAPLSFAGSGKRLWRLSDNVIVRLLILLPLVLAAWIFILGWYCAFGIFLIPYRLLRRGQRKRKLEDARHRELLEVVKQRG
jgi:hypothetical protein